MSGRGELPGQSAGGGGALGEVPSPLPAQVVCQVLLGRNGQVQGVALQDGTEVRSKLVLSNASPQITFLELTPQVWGTQDWQGLGTVTSPVWAVPLTAELCPGLSHPRSSCQRTLSNGSGRLTHAPLSPRSTVGTGGASFAAVPSGRTLVAGCRAQQEAAPIFPPAPLPCPVAVDRLPSFLAAPNACDGQPLPHHQCSIHLNCESTHLLHQAFTEATHGHPSSR